MYRDAASELLTVLIMRKKRECETMNARELILQADAIRNEKGMSQAEWSRVAGLDGCGMIISRTFNRGNCKVSTLETLLRPLGYELRIMKLEDIP